MSFNYKNPISPLTSLGTISLPRTEVYGTNFSVLSTGGFMEVYSVSDLYYIVPSGSTGLIEYTGNTIPIQFQKGTGSIFSPDVLTLNSDNISSGRRRLGMLVYVIDSDQIYQYQIPNFENLWTGATSATGPGGSTVVISDFGTTIKSNSPEGIAFISAWTANTIEGISGETSSTAVWKKLVTGGGGGVSGDYLPLSGGTVTGDTIFTSGLTANTFSASTYLGLPQDVFVTGGTYSAGTATFTNNTGGTFDVIGFVSADTYTTGFTFDIANYDLTIKRNDGIDLTTNLSILASDVTITGGTYDPNTGTATFTNNTGGTFNVTGFLTGFTDIYVTGGTFDKNSETLTLERNDGNSVVITGFTDVFVTGGTYSAGTATFTNNTGGTFNVSGFYTGATDVFVTGGTFSKSAETLTLLRNDNNSIPITGFTDVFVTGGTYSNGTLFLTNNSGSTFSVAGFSTATGGTSNYYGSFSDTTNQSVSGANIATVWTYNTTELSNGIYIQDGSKIKVSNDGIYEIGYSAQIEKTQGGTSSDVTIWAVVNGNPVVRSSSTLTLANNSVYQLPFVSYIFELYAGDYVEFYFSSPSQYIQITTLSGLTSPTRPVSPSVIIVAKAIGNAVLNTSGDSFVTGFSLTNDTLTLSQNRVGLYSGFSVNLPYLNTSGGTITGNLSVSGSVSATTYYGNGSNLTGISRGGGGGAGGQLYYFNISNTQTPYYEFSTTATTAAEQTISATASSNATVLIGGFMTPSTLPNITNFPAGILSFYFHTYDGGTNHSFNIYGELYKRTTGGTETLLFTSDVAAVVGNVVTMVISDGYFSGATLNSSDRLVVKVYGTNITNQTRTIYLVSEGSSHYSFALTTIPTFTDTYVTGFTYSNNTLTIKQNNNQADLTSTINTFTGLTANTISATTYQNLPTDIRVTGGTYSNGTATFTNNTGGTFNVSGFYTGATDVFVTGATYNNANQFTFTNNTGGTFNVSFNQVTGLTATTISATTYQNLPTSGTVTSVSALTLGTSGTDLSSTVANSTSTPVITLNVPTASATNRGVLSSSDWNTFNNKQSTITVGTIDSQAKVANGLVLTSNVLYTQTADATNVGMVSTGTQTFAGAKILNANGAASTPVFRLTGNIFSGGTNITTTPQFLIEPTKLSYNSVTGVAATDTITVTGHAFTNLSVVYFTSLTGGSGLTINTLYYVISIVGNTFKLANSLSNANGGNPIDFTTDITSATIVGTGIWNTNGTYIGANALDTTYSGRLIDLQTGGISRLSYTTGGGTASLLTLNADSNVNTNNYILFTGGGNGTDFYIGSSRSVTYPSDASFYSIIGMNGGNGIRINPRNGIVQLNGNVSITDNTKGLITSANGRTYLISGENAGTGGQARITFGPTQYTPNSSSESSFTFNGAVNGLSSSTVSLSGLRLSQTITPNAATPLIIGQHIVSTLVASANNQVLTALQIQPTFTNGAFTGLTNNVINILSSGGNNLFKSTDAGAITLGYSTASIGFYGVTPIVRPTTTIVGATRAGGGGIPVTTLDTYGGYTIAQMAQAMINLGLLT